MPHTTHNGSAGDPFHFYSRQLTGMLVRLLAVAAAGLIVWPLFARMLEVGARVQAMMQGLY